MSSKTASFLALCLLMAVAAGSQSLGEVAKKERERREKNKESGVSVRAYTEDEISEDEAEDGEEGPGIDGDVEADEDDESPGASAPDRIPGRIDVPLEPDPSEALEEESRNRRRREVEWRNRMHEARARVERARKQKAVWDGVHYVDGITLVDENGNVVVDSREDLRRWVDQANQELADAEQALRDLEEKARRAGVPPGWLR